MTKDKLSVTIAIPAFNEEKSIVNLLWSINKQKQIRYRVDAVWVYSDGSTDSTVSIVKENFPEVKVRAFRQNKGKHRRLNQMLSSLTADIFILVDADIKFLSNSVLDEMVGKFDSNKVGVVCAYHRAVEPKTVFGHIAYFGYKVWDTARSSLGKKGIRYYCEAGTMAFSKEFAEAFLLPEDGRIGDDSYCFYFAVQNRFDVVVAKKAKVYFDIADNYTDYKRQMKRFLADNNALRECFGQELTKKYETLTFMKAMRALLRETLRSPLKAIAYICLQFVIKLQMPFYQTKAGWIHIRRTS